MKILKLLVCFLMILALGACKKFLQEAPTRQSVIETTDQLEALINNATQFSYDGSPGSGGQNGSAGYSTDDTEIPMDIFKLYTSGKWTIDNLYYYTFKTDEIVGLSSDPIWNGEFRKIFMANLVLVNLDKVSGDAALKSDLRANAHFIRAYSYWTLANHHCMPMTSSNKDLPEMGLPLKRSTDFEESFVRTTLKETYDFIEADLAEAALTTRDDVDPTKPWRVNKKAVEAFRSRYYLFLGNYDQSLIHTNNALASTTATLVDFRTIIAGTPQTYTAPTVTLPYSELNDWTAAKHLYWKEFYYPRFSYQSSQWLLPSTNLRSLFDQVNDLRFKWLMIPNSNRRFTILATPPGLYRYAYFFDGRYIPTGPTVAEMLLNKAEILARKGDIPNAMAAVNTLRAKRINPISNLDATSQAEAIKKILDERRREFPFSFRWYDIRRFSVNNYPADDVTVSRQFFKVNVGSVDTTVIETYTLPVSSKRYAVPINGVERMASKNIIKQNEY